MVRDHVGGPNCRCTSCLLARESETETSRTERLRTRIAELERVVKRTADEFAAQGVEKCEAVNACLAAEQERDAVTAVSIALQKRIADLEKWGGGLEISCFEKHDQIVALKAHNARLIAELREHLETMMLAEAALVESGSRAGWRDSMARSHLCEAGDRLVELGAWKRHPDGYGRRWFYRPIANEPEEETDD